jgi:hypothetical protein
MYAEEVPFAKLSC